MFKKIGKFVEENGEAALNMARKPGGEFKGVFIPVVWFAGLLVASVFSMNMKVYAALPSASVVNSEIGHSSGTTFVQVYTGAGYLFDIVAASAPANGYTVCFDSASTTGLTANGDGTTGATRLPFAFAPATGTAHIQSNVQGIGFGNGLACGNSATFHSNVLYKPQ